MGHGDTAGIFDKVKGGGHTRDSQRHQRREHSCGSSVTEDEYSFGTDSLA